MTAHRYRVTVEWTGDWGRGTADYRAYGRDHVVRVPGKPDLLGSADRAFRGDPGRYNPEDLLVAALSQCHLLSYLHVCATSGVVVLAYTDRATGTMVADRDGGGRFTEVLLRPQVRVAAGGDVDLAVRLHERAHTLCFIANSVNFPVRCDPTVVTA